MSSGIFLTAEWRHLVMVNFEVDPKLLAPFVPSGTELDFWEGKTYLSIVGFRFLNTKVFGVPVPFHRNFSEVNLRFYVKRVIDNEARRGVVFIKEIVHRMAIAWVARFFYNENYVTLQMKSELNIPENPSDAGSAKYAWRSSSGWSHAELRFSGEPNIPGGESLDAFIAEHYWGYTSQSDGTTLEYKVEHPPWRLWQCGEVSMREAGAVYDDFGAILGTVPSSSFLAEGSQVAVRRGVRLE